MAIFFLPALAIVTILVIITSLCESVLTDQHKALIPRTANKSGEGVNLIIRTSTSNNKVKMIGGIPCLWYRNFIQGYPRGCDS